MLGSCAGFSSGTRFGRTCGLTRGIYGSALGALRGVGWAFPLPACLSPRQDLSTLLLVCFFMRFGAILLRSVRSFAASFSLLGNRLNVRGQGQGRGQGRRNLSPLSLPLPLLLFPSKSYQLSDQHSTRLSIFSWRDGGRGWGGVGRRFRCRWTIFWTHTIGHRLGHTEGTLCHFGMSLGVNDWVAGSQDPDRPLGGFGRRWALYLPTYLL